MRHLTKAAIKAMMARQLPDSFVDIHNILMDEASLQGFGDYFGSAATAHN